MIFTISCIRWTIQQGGPLKFWRYDMKKLNKHLRCLLLAGIMAAALCVPAFASGGGGGG